MGKPRKKKTSRQIGKKWASKGGKARANALTRQERSAIAKQAANKRWKPKNEGVSTHMGVLYQMLTTWVLALDWLGEDPDSLTLQYEPPTGGDIRFTLHGGSDLTYCECKMRGREPTAAELRRWFTKLYREHASEIAACQGQVTLTIVTSLQPGSKLYRAAANLAHRPGYLRSKLKLDDDAIPYPCKLQLVHLPGDLEVLSAKIGWGLISRLGLPLSPQTVRQHLRDIEISLLQGRQASRGEDAPAHNLQALLVAPLRTAAQEQLKIQQIEAKGKVDPATERARLEELLALQRAGGAQPTTVLRAKVHGNARLLADVIDFCRQHPGECKEALLSLVGGFRTEFPLFQELETLVPSHITWHEALDIVEAALSSRSKVAQQLALELLQKADASDQTIVDRVLRIAAETLAEHAGTDESNDDVLEEVGNVALKLLPNLDDERKREVVEDIFITCSQLLTDHSWYHIGTAPVLYEVARALALESFENFRWFIKLLTEAHKEKSIYSVIPYRGYEDMGHGTSQAGSGFSTGDYNYGAAILTPALKKFEAERPEGWDAFWKGVRGATISPEHPVWLKRAAIPVLLEQAQRGGEEGEAALDALMGYTSILRGIPSPSEILFEQLTRQKEVLSEQQRLSLVEADIHSLTANRQVYPCPSSIFAFEVLFQLCVSQDSTIRSKAHALVNEFISSDKVDILQQERLRSFSERLYILLEHPESKELLRQVVEAFLVNVDGLMKIENYDEPTTCFVSILEKIFLANKEEGHTWVGEVFLTPAVAPYGQRIVAGMMLHFAEKQETLPLYEELREKYAAHIDSERLRYLEARYADALQKQAPEQSLDSCINILETSLEHPDRQADEYRESDKNMEKKDDVHFINGTEGHALFTLHQVARLDPKRAYATALRYWLESPSPYLRHMACYALRITISNLLSDPKKKYLYEKARHYLKDFAGDGLSRLQEYLMKWPAMWMGTSGVMNVLKHCLTYEEAKKLLELGKELEGTEWVFFYFANYHGTQATYEGPEWTKEQKEKMLEDFQSYLVEGGERGITHLLTGIRDVVRKGKCDAAHVAMMDHVLRKRPKNNLHEMNTFGLALSDAKEHGDEQLRQFVEPFLDLWLIPIMVQIDPDGPFVYVHQCDDLLGWLQDQDPKRAKELAGRLLVLPEKWRQRIFPGMDLEAMSNG
jgi:hypothetical protein